MYVGQIRLIKGNSASDFKDEGEVQHIQERIRGLDSQLRSLQQQRQQLAYQNPDNLDRSIQDVTRQKKNLEEELRRANESGGQGNHFLFTLVSMEPGLPEDEQVRKWIAESGIDKD
jgi:chromosome segregation ATPase